jgi:hypothetical protein
MFLSKKIFQFFVFGGESCKMRARGHFRLPVKNWFRSGGEAVEVSPQMREHHNFAALSRMILQIVR